MKPYLSVFLVSLLAGAALPSSSHAEQRYLSWAPVATYIDGTSIETDKTVTYTAYWTTDPALSPGTLRQMISRLPETSFPFDPDAEGIPRGQTIYFTAKSVVSTGEESSLSAVLSWKFPVLVPASPAKIATSSRAPWQIFWDAVTTYTDGTPIGTGKTVLYTAFWTPDPYLAPESLHAISPPTSGTSLSFDPAAAGMAGHRTVYFTVTAVLSTGESSAFSDALAWNVPLEGPLPPENMVITALPEGEYQGMLRLSWNAVTQYGNGTPIGPGKTVLYNIYWTTDPGLAAGALTPLASSLDTTSFMFDPLAFGMKRNRRVYFAGKSILNTGEESALSTGVSWRVSNPGPNAPSNGKVVRKNQK